MNKHRFLVIASPRSGSTWLETSLGSLPDCFADYELKWNIQYHGIALRLIPDSPEACDRILENMRNNHRIVGSKLILDERPYSADELSRLSATIGADTKIIHLYRDYFESIVSRWNPFGKRAILARNYKGPAINEAARKAPYMNRLRMELISLTTAVS